MPGSSPNVTSLLPETALTFDSGEKPPGHVRSLSEAPIEPEDKPKDATIVSSTASQQHQHEQELLQSFAVPEPPVLTQELTLAAGADTEERSSGPPEPPRTLWMGDLDPWLDERAIVDLWWQISRQEVSVKLIRPRLARQAGPQISPQNGPLDGPSTAHSGYCFVEFPLFEAAQHALGLNGQLLPDIALPSQQQFRDNPDNQKKYFRLNWALGATLSAPIVELPEFSLFVGDLSASTTEAHLLLFFQKLFPHSVRTVRVMTDPILGKLRCFGFVRFSDENERQRALVEMNGVWFGGRPLRVANATPRLSPLYRKPQELRFPPYQPEMLPNMYGAGYFPPQMGQDMYGGGGGGGGAGAYVDPANTTVFVGGLSLDVTDQTLYTLFKPFGLIVQIKLPPGKNCGFVKYASREEAEDAISNMEGYVIGGHRVRLGWGRVSASNKRFSRMHMQMPPVPMYDPNAGYAGLGYGMPQGATSQMYAPMAMQMRPPGMYPYGGPEMAEIAESLSLTGPVGRSRSLDHSVPPPGYELLAQNFDSLLLDAVAPYQNGQVPFNPYSYPENTPGSASRADASHVHSGSDTLLIFQDSQLGPISAPVSLGHALDHGPRDSLSGQK